MRRLGLSLSGTFRPRLLRIGRMDQPARADKLLDQELPSYARYRQEIIRRRIA